MRRSNLVRAMTAGIAAISTFTVAPLFAQVAAEKPAAQKAPEASLKIGDKAPALSVETWVKGEEVKEFAAGKPYVVEFWATWCGPCIVSMPHLSALQKEYKAKGLTIIGVTSVDQRGNSFEKVKAMVADKGDTMGYTVAWDKDRATNEAYMKASNQGGIPTSFVVDGKGNIAWIGHPMFLDIVLEKVVGGEWDYKTGPALVKKAEDAQGLVYKKMRTDPKAALEALAKLETEYPKLAEGMASLKCNLLMATGDFEGAFKAAVAKEDAQSLNAIAWTIVDPEGNVENKNLELAMKAATKADELANHKDPATIDTLARVYFLKGDTAKAIELQTKAIDLAEGEMKAELQKSLDEYKKKGDKHD